MGFRFRRSFSVAKGVRVNLSKGGLGVSVGGKGARIGVGPRGPYTSASIPGTGIYSINYLDKKAKKKDAGEHAVQPVQRRAQEKAPQYPSLQQVGLEPAHTFWFWLGAIILAIFGTSARLLSVVLIALWLFRRSKPLVRFGMVYQQGVRAATSGEYAKAIECFEQVQGEKPSPYISLALAQAYQQSGDTESAVRTYKEYLNSIPSDTGIQIRLISLLMLEGRYQEAVPILESLPEEIRQEPTVIGMLGACLIESGNPSLAIEVLKKAPLQKRTPDPVLTTIRYALGKAYQATSDNKKALQMFRKVYADDPGFEDVREQIAELELRLNGRDQK